MALSGTGLGCIRGERLVFQNIDFRLGPGRVLLLHGPNGSGKSSLLRVVAGLLDPAAGEILWRGQPVADDVDAYRAALRYVGHVDAIKPAFTARQNLRFWAELQGIAGAQVSAGVDGALARVGLGMIGDNPARLLSAGQKRRLNLARLMLAPAALWLLDEPTTALDQAGVAMFAEMMAEHGAGGGLAMVATHVDLGLGAVDVLDLGRAPA